MKVSVDRDALRRVAVSASKDKTWATLPMVCVQGAFDGARMMATDTHRLAIEPVGNACVTGPGGYQWECLLPPERVKSLLAGRGPVVIDTETMGCPWDATYPPVDRVVPPGDSEVLFTATVGDLVAMLDLVPAPERRSMGDSSVVLCPVSGGLSVTPWHYVGVDEPYGYGRTRRGSTPIPTHPFEVDASCSAGWVMRLNARFLRDVLRWHKPGAVVTVQGAPARGPEVMKWGHPTAGGRVNTPLRITYSDSATLVVLMPMQAD